MVGQERRKRRGDSREITQIADALAGQFADELLRGLLGEKLTAAEWKELHDRLRGLVLKAGLAFLPLFKEASTQDITLEREGYQALIDYMRKRREEDERLIEEMSRHLISVHGVQVRVKMHFDAIEDGLRVEVSEGDVDTIPPGLPAALEAIPMKDQLPGQRWSWLSRLRRGKKGDEGELR